MKNVLNSVQKEIPITITESNVPAVFFQDRKGLYVGYSFSSNISEKAKAVEAGTEFKISSFDLKERANDEEIENALSKEHIFSESDICAIVADLIEKQQKGEEGILLNNGYANLFYTLSRVVVVGWSGGKWRVIDWRRGDDSWDGGHRVFSPATDA